MSRASLRRRPIVVLAMLLLAWAGISAWRQLPVDAFPDVSVPQVKVVLKAPGMTPEEVESRITVPIEQELLGIPGQRMLRSVAKYALTDVTVDFADGTDVYWARNQVAERLARVLPDLPEGVSGGLAPATTPLGEVFMFTVENPALSLAERRSLLDWVVRPRLRTIEGVAEVNSLGGEVRSFEVSPRPMDMNARGVSLVELADALRANSRNDGAGRVREGSETMQVRVEAGVLGLDDLAAIGIATRGGVPVRVGDVADLRIGSLTRYGAVSHDGKGETVQGLVLSLRGADARAIVGRVRARLAEIEAALPAGTRLVPFYDRGDLVDRAVSTVTRALLEAAVLVVVLLFAFLGNVRAALVVAATLPLAALAAFVAMRWAGMSANLMSLGGLAIAIGMLVDGAVVVVEHAVSRLQAAPAGRPTIETIGEAVGEVARPVATGVGIIALVFVPLLTLEGYEGKMFSPVALAIVFALAASLVLSLTAVPVMASLAFARAPSGRAWLMERLLPAYARVLDWAFARPRWVAGGAAVLLLAAIAALPLLGRSFVPTLDEGDVIVQLEKLPSISLEASVDLDLKVQRALMERVPEVRGVVARTGSDELGLDPMGLNQTDSFVMLVPREQWRQADKAWVLDRLREVLADFPGIAASFTQPIEMRVSEMLSGVRGDLAVKVFGPDLETLGRLSDSIAAALRGVDGAEDVFALRNEGVLTLRVVVDRLAAARLGVSAEQLQRTMRMEVEGEPVGLVVEAGRRTPVLLRGPGHLREDPRNLADLQLAFDPDTVAPLSGLARILHSEGPVKIDREFGQRYVTVQSNVRGRDLVGFVADARVAVDAAVKLPEGYRLVWGGQFENQQRASARLALVVPAVVALVLFVLWLSFGSVATAVLIVGLVPFAVAGAVFSLLGFGEYLSVPASVGFIALLGIAVLNGVVMVETFDRRLAEGAPPREAASAGALERLRPVLMTATITGSGLVPLLLATGPGSEVQRPLAVVVVGGLVSATAVTLVVLPVAWRWLAQRRLGRT
nr:CusA/CzcA family heavy metal efflux RND transporter [Quisquiliibacterium transsilvanicum]